MASEPELPEPKDRVTISVIEVTQLDSWNEHHDAFSEAEGVLGWEKLHVAPWGRLLRVDQRTSDHDR